MTKAIRLVGVCTLLGVLAGDRLTAGQPTRPMPPRPAATGLSPQQQRAAEEANDKSPFAQVGVFTYRPAPTRQIFALSLRPELPGSQPEGRDFLVLMSLAANQAGEGWLASMQIVEQMALRVGPQDRVSLWTIGTPEVTKPVLEMGFFSPRDAVGQKRYEKLKAALQKTFPAGDTDLKSSLTRAIDSFEDSPRRQRIILFLGDGQSTHNPMDNEDRFGLVQKMVERKIAFFPVPLGVHVDARNLHGLATGSGGLVLRTQVGEEALDDVMKRYFDAFAGPILYDPQLTLPATVKMAFPTRLPPLRSDAATLVIGEMSAATAPSSPSG